MNANFVFPRSQHQLPRPRPARVARWSSTSPSSPAASRDSNALRASILDTALELGIGSNPLVTKWMFNNPLIEEPEDVLEPIPSPCLTLDSSTSEQTMHSASSSWLHSQYPSDLINGHGHNLNINQDVNKLPFQRGEAGAVDMDFHNFNPNKRASNITVRNSESISVNDSTIAYSHIPRPKSVTSSVRKLRKKHPGREEYEILACEKNAKTKEKSGDGMVKKKKSFVQVINKSSNDVQSPSLGYETDGGVPSFQKSKKDKKKTKTKNPSKETGYETDGGYQSDNKKSKTRFFKLSSKSLKYGTDNGPVPALPNFIDKKRESVVPLPIAGRFARTLSFSMPSPTATTEGAETPLDSSFPRISFLPFTDTFDLTSTASSSSPVSAGPFNFDRAQTAPTSEAPSAFNAHLHPMNRDSRSSVSSSSSGSGSNQHNKLQNLKGLFSPLHSAPSSKQGHQQHVLRPSSSLSSLIPPKPVISLPITRDTSTNPPLSTRSLHSMSVSPTSTSFRSSIASFQFKKPFRINLHQPDLPTQQQSPTPTLSSSSSGPGSPQVILTPPLPHLQIPRFTKVRPKNPPIDGFGPRFTSDSAALGFALRPNPISSPALTSPGLSPTDSSGGLSPNSHIRASSKRSSEQTIIPSSDYIVPSPLNSPLKTQHPGPPSPTVLTTYYHHDHIPPQPSPAPKGPLPTPPSSSENGESPARNSGSHGSSSSIGSTGQHLPLAVHLRQRLSKMNMRKSLLPSQSTSVATRSGVENAGYIGLRIDKKNGNTGHGAADDISKYKKGKAKEGILRSRFADDERQSWIDINDEDTNLDTREVEDQQQEDLYDILDRFENRVNEREDIHSSSSEQALERSHSFKAGKHTKEKRSYDSSDNGFNNSRSPRHHRHVPAAVVVPDLYGFDFDDGKSTGDRTSRWTESVYSRSSSSSILDEEESEGRRDRLVRRVEAMLDEEKKGGQAQEEHTLSPLLVPEMTQAYANIKFKQNGNGNRNIDENAGHHLNMTPGRSWNKF